MVELPDLPIGLVSNPSGHRTPSLGVNRSVSRRLGAMVDLGTESDGVRSRLAPAGPDKLKPQSCFSNSISSLIGMR